jgi:hypothetical protein
MPSQNGANRDFPHRHKAMIFRFLGSTSPVESTISIGPRTSKGPSAQIVIRVKPAGSRRLVIAGF